MKTVKTKDELRQALASQRGTTIGLVPTMGYLHAGHLSLIERARQECGCVVASIFVNPLQFGPQEDFATYPRDLERDAMLAKEAGVDILFAPSTDEMYPEPPLTNVTVSSITEILCGASRPGHFDGVGTVVTKLFNLVQPQRAYFGLKDIQQVAVIQRMTTDLDFPVTIVPCSTVREADGLAMSSRNVHLSAEERSQATILYRALTTGKQRVLSGEWLTGDEVEHHLKEMIASQPLAEIDYVNILTFPELEPVSHIAERQYVIALAVRIGKTRLIDNMLIRKEAGHVPQHDEG